MNYRKQVDINQNLFHNVQSKKSVYRGSGADEYCTEPVGCEIQERQSSPNVP